MSLRWSKASHLLNRFQNEMAKFSMENPEFAFSQLEKVETESNGRWICALTVRNAQTGERIQYQSTQVRQLFPVEVERQIMRYYSLQKRTARRGPHHMPTT